MPGFNKYLIIGLLATYTLFFSLACLAKLHSFLYFDYDLAVYAQLLWNIAHGSGYSSLMGVHFLGNHAQPILFFIAPIYSILPFPATLLLLQVIVLAVALVPIYLIARKYLPQNLSLAIAVMYILYPALAFTNLFEFHPVVFSTLFLAMMMYFFDNNDYKKFIVCMILSISCQENISLVIIFIAGLAVVKKRPLKWSVIPIVTGLLYFLLYFYIVMPYFNKGQVNLIKFYAHLGETVPQILVNIIGHPFQNIQKIFSNQLNIKYLTDLFLPVTFTSLIGGEYLLVIMPLFLQHLLSARTSEHTIYYHYAAEMLPFIFIAAIFGLRRIFKIKLMSNHSSLISAILICVAIFSCLVIGPIPFIFRDLSFPPNYSVARKNQMLKAIPHDAAVIASFSYLPKLANRMSLLSFHNVTTGYYPHSNKKFVVPADIRFALVDFNEPLILNSFYGPGSSKNIMDFFSNNNWGTLSVEDTTVLFEKGAQDKVRLFEKNLGQPKVKNERDVIVDNGIKLIGTDFEYIPHAKMMRIILNWQCLIKVNTEINTFIDFIDMHGNVAKREFRPICYRIFSTDMWQANQFITEYRYMPVPRLPAGGRYMLKMGFYDFRNGRLLKSQSNFSSLDKQGRITLGEIET